MVRHVHAAGDAGSTSGMCARGWSAAKRPQLPVASVGAWEAVMPRRPHRSPAALYFVLRAQRKAVAAYGRALAASVPPVSANAMPAQI